MTNFEQKKNDDPLDVHRAIIFGILAGIRGIIGSSTAGLGSGPCTSAVWRYAAKCRAYRDYRREAEDTLGASRLVTLQLTFELFQRFCG